MRTLRASEIHADAAVRVIAIEAVCCRPQKLSGLCQLYAYIEPTALVVCAGGSNRVVSLMSAQTSLAELKRDVPGLRALLADDQ